jgi:rhamnogalacturonyl hydrolase YesR
MKRILFPAFLAALLALLVLSGCCATQSRHESNTPPAPVTIQPDSGGITDAEIRGVVERVARRQVHTLADGDYSSVTNLDGAKAARAPGGIQWVYPWGVALYGMMRSTDITGDKDIGPFVVQHNAICVNYYDWLAGLEKQLGQSTELADFERRGSLRLLTGLGSLDSCGAMGTEMIEGMTRYPESVTPEEKAVLARIADWVVNKQDRLPDGTLWRSRQLGGTVWPDDLFMGGVFLVHYGTYTGDQRYIDDAASNIIHQAALEQDADGLWFHGYFVNQKQHALFKWGRGNGWVMVTLAETLSAMPDNDPLRPQILDIFRKQLDGLKQVQAPDGMWRQVLDKPELWEETSCTAMFTYSIARAVNRGWIDPSNMVVARRAFAALAKNVTPEGAVNGTCEGTNIGTDLDFYINRQRPEDDWHGRGPVMLAGTEILRGGEK